MDLIAKVSKLVEKVGYNKALELMQDMVELQGVKTLLRMEDAIDEELMLLEADRYGRAYRLAIDELNKAYNNLDNAAPEYIDIALLEIDAARQKVDEILKEMKGAKGQ